ncbi:uncharacterized protein CEXT_362011 [Caerostris extrusa]|uniref:Uncharacterized protein n=1 Tax=Caerostris extrusa TaxID=172846 RepID=A0AAV4QFK1_CAEEX|nr:uncharacterized protein CEXT_362011 [Caerostris extrusa]
MISEEETCFEDVLEKNYCPETNDEEKIFIHAMIRRLKRILNWDPGEDESLFTKDKGPEIVRDIMIHFIRWKTIIGSSNNLADFIGLQHLVIYTMAKLCFYYWIRDSRLVSDVLRQVYLCDGHFSSMFAHIMNQNDRRTLWPTPNQETRHKEYLTMVFFLSHAHNARLEFGGHRFVDLRLRVPLRVPPVFLAAIYNKPQLLLLIMRHGAILDRRQASGRADDWDLNMLLRHLTRILWASLGSDPQDSTWETSIISSTLHDVWECLRFLLRGISQVQMGN